MDNEKFEVMGCTGCLFISILISVFAISKIEQSVGRIILGGGFAFVAGMLFILLIFLLRDEDKT